MKVKEDNVLVMDDCSVVAVAIKGNIAVITEMYKPVKYGQNYGIDLEVLETVGYFVELSNKKRIVESISEYQTMGEL